MTTHKNDFYSDNELFEFYVAPFTNPFNSVPVTGFEVSLYDSNGFIMSKTHHELKLESVDTAAEFESAKVYFSGSSRVGEESNIGLFLSMNFPFNATECYVKVGFPEEFTLYKDRLTSVKGDGIFQMNPNEEIEIVKLDNELNEVTIRACTNGVSFFSRGKLIFSTV